MPIIMGRLLGAFIYYSNLVGPLIFYFDIYTGPLIFYLYRLIVLKMLFNSPDHHLGLRAPIMHDLLTPPPTLPSLIASFVRTVHPKPHAPIYV